MYLLVILINLMHHCLTKVLFSLEKNFTDPDFWTVVHDQIFKNYGKFFVFRTFRGRNSCWQPGELQLYLWRYLIYAVLEEHWERQGKARVGSPNHTHGPLMRCDAYETRRPVTTSATYEKTTQPTYRKAGRRWKDSWQILVKLAKLVQPSQKTKHLDTLLSRYFSK